MIRHEAGSTIVKGKEMKTYLLIIKSVFAAGLLVASSASFAIPISGSIELLGGVFNPVATDGTTIVSLADAKGIQFSPNTFTVGSASTDDFVGEIGVG
jgi:hypothetical protein